MHPTASDEESECREIHTGGVGSNMQKSKYLSDARSVRQFSSFGGHGILAVGDIVVP